MMINSATVALLIAAFLDYLIADPPFLPHPVQGMGMVISFVSKTVTNFTKNSLLRRIAGVVLGLGLIIGSGCLGWGLVYFSKQISIWLGLTIEVILLASCFAARSLRNAAIAVLTPLKNNEIETARTQLSYYVGRDTNNLSPPEILRAVLETIAENTTDGVTAPLFYAIVGLLIPPVGIVPFALAYKAASTLDSMIGYQREPFTDIGWFSAKFEDILTWLPCRLTVLTIGLLGRKPRQVWQVGKRDATQDPSPNAGWSECAYAVVLGVQLGGENTYQGLVKKKPLLGNPDFQITEAKIEQALGLTRTCFLSWLVLGVALSGAVG
ncbi:cobalamin biosynthesis protein [Euhalothece natronophila Z-M001]|uniref:Cobalamin biosynthesis protein CobD n=2 Tax=Euhalothece TaxID=65097 RepID=A0A5B8NQ34_9CHRO|nr:cobalamin biosynthesis protein [Euhalothece natronophila Z-M001]